MYCRDPVSFCCVISTRSIRKVFDTRCFHKFGEQVVHRERTQRIVTFASLHERGLPTDPSVYLDAEAALPVLDLTAGVCRSRSFSPWLTSATDLASPAFYPISDREVWESFLFECLGKLLSGAEERAVHRYSCRSITSAFRSVFLKLALYYPCTRHLHM